jgi:DNA-binding response OmpR family regulator
MPSPNGKIWVLMVDDNEEHVELCKESLPAEEFDVDAAGTGTEALQMLEANFYDIVVLDYSLPDFSGLELLKRIKVRGFNVPTVFVSASNDPDLSMRALKAGACDYIVKTFRYYANLRSRLMENIDACSTRRR